MRSLRELACIGLVAVAACGTEWVPQGSSEGGGDDEVMHVDEAQCETSYLTYDNFGEPFVLDWCRGCHSAAIPAGMRQKAPAAINFDTPDDVRQLGPRIGARAASTTPSMPPAGGPTLEERRLLAEWVTCGMR